MFVQIKRKDKEYDVPKYQTPGSVGFDFTTREDATIWPNEIVLIPANATVRTPKGYMLMVALRSSAPRKWGVTIPQELVLLIRITVVLKTKLCCRF